MFIDVVCAFMTNGLNAVPFSDRWFAVPGRGGCGLEGRERGWMLWGSLMSGGIGLLWGDVGHFWRWRGRINSD